MKNARELLYLQSSFLIVKLKHLHCIHYLLTLDLLLRFSLFIPGSAKNLMQNYNEKTSV